MSKQPEALRLVDACDTLTNLGMLVPGLDTVECAAELRRLYLVEQALDRCRVVCDATSEGWRADAERWQAQRDALLAERDHARDQFDRAVKLLISIHSCMYPSAVKLEDGRLMVFRPENPHEYLQALSDRIRALPDEIAAIKAVEEGK